MPLRIDGWWAAVRFEQCGLPEQPAFRYRRDGLERELHRELHDARIARASYCAEQTAASVSGAEPTPMLHRLLSACRAVMRLTRRLGEIRPSEGIASPVFSVPDRICSSRDCWIW